jgi:hypothetical protein
VNSVGGDISQSSKNANYKYLSYADLYGEGRKDAQYRAMVDEANPLNCQLPGYYPSESDVDLGWLPRCHRPEAFVFVESAKMINVGEQVFTSYGSSYFDDAQAAKVGLLPRDPECLR